MLVAAVVTAMSGHVDDLEVQDSGLVALMGITSHGLTAQADTGQHGAHQAVVTAMARHSASLEVQRSGCGALCNLAQHTGARSLLISANVHGTVLEAMASYMGDVRTQV